MLQLWLESLLCRENKRRRICFRISVSFLLIKLSLMTAARAVVTATGGAAAFFTTFDDAACS